MAPSRIGAHLLLSPPTFHEPEIHETCGYVRMSFVVAKIYPAHQNPLSF